MGGGGSYYDRDVIPRSSRSTPSSPSSQAAAVLTSTMSLHKDMNPRGRPITCMVSSPIVYAFDITGSMGKLPQIIWDKMPMIVGQISARNYLSEFQICLAAIGDAGRGDSAPVQVGSFSSPREADLWFKKIYLEGGGGGNNIESYELVAYYFAYMASFPNATHPFCLFTGDEGVYNTIPADRIKQYLDPNYSGTDLNTKDVFKDLLDKFNGNVFCVHRYYDRGDSDVVSQWKSLLGNGRVVCLPKDDFSIGDVTLGLFSIASGSRSLSQYIEDMNTRPLDLAVSEKFTPQTPQRVNDVREALVTLGTFQMRPNPKGVVGMRMEP